MVRVYYKINYFNRIYNYIETPNLSIYICINMYDRIIIFIGTIVFAYILYLLLYSILVMFIGPLAGITRLLSIVLIIMFYGSIKAVISGMI